MERLKLETIENIIGVEKTTIEAFEKNGEIVTLDKCILMGMEELKQYRIAEEQGMLIRLPCKVGDTVWKISRFLIGSECGDLPDVWYRIDQDNFTLSMIGYYGKTIFITKEKAEQALARMVKENGD